jgi:peptidoglycan/LPS O-acetylase OafA/YrhL
MSSTAYRPDIDGLRAVAVLLVVIFHSGFTFVPGGFAGVDVFFTISGFLITTIIHREVTNKTFTYAGFYQRRIRRLMPALFAMLLATTIAAAFLLFPSDLVAYGKSVLAASFAISNVYFWRVNGGYFGGNAQEVPLLHTWSLSVEEQYYFTWPLYLILCHRLFTPRATVAVTVVALLACLILSEWIARITFGAAYYLLPTRMFELMIGSLLAMTWTAWPPLRRPVANAVSVAGIGMIVYSAVMIDSSFRFPGINALYSTIGTALIILAGKSESAVVNRVLSLRPFVFVGLISYSVYLWHWPLIVFVRYIGVEFTTTLSLAFVVSSLLLGWFSWKYVELPFRTKRDAQHRINLGRTFAKLYAAPVAVALGFVAIVIASNGLPARFEARIVAMDAAIATQPAALRGPCHSQTRNAATPPLDSCVLGVASSSAQTSAFLIGDSHANHFTGFVDELARDAGVQVNDYTLNTCLPVFELNWGPSAYYSDICKRRNQANQRYIADNHFDYVILAGKWPASDDIDKVIINGATASTENALRQEFALRLRQTLQAIIAAGADPVIIKDSVATQASPRCALLKASFNAKVECDVPSATALAGHRLFDDILAELGADFPTLIVIDPKEIMCNSDKCLAAVSDTPLYLDATHLNDTASRKLAKLYLDRHVNPLKPIPPKPTLLSSMSMEGATQSDGAQGGGHRR